MIPGSSAYNVLTYVAEVSASRQPSAPMFDYLMRVYRGKLAMSIIIRFSGRHLRHWRNPTKIPSETYMLPGHYCAVDRVEDYSASLTHSITARLCHGPCPFEMLEIRSPAFPTTSSHIWRVRCLPPNPSIMKSSVAAIWFGRFSMMSSCRRSLLPGPMASATRRRMLVLAASP